MAEKVEKTPSRYRIDLCDGYYAMKDPYCYTLYNTRNKVASVLHPDVDVNETKDVVLGYYTEVSNMLWAIVENKVDAKAISKKKALTLSEYITIYENARDEVMNAVKIKE